MAKTKKPTTEEVKKPVDYKKLNGWDGHSKKGEAIYDQLFEQEKEEQELYDPSDRYGHYDF